MTASCSGFMRLPLATIGAALLLAACGGGGGGGDTPPASPSPPPPVLQSSVPVTVVDGPIRNAKVCLDKNRNNVCDADEPTASTDASGNATLKVDPADVGKFPILAEVGTDAVDMVNGTVTTAFVLKAPADRSGVVSPLTTLVQNTVANTGATSDVAEAAIRAQLGVSSSLFTDFTKATGADATKLGTLARMVVVTTQSQTKLLTPAVGTQAIDGKTIQIADVNSVVQQRVLQALPDVVAKLGDTRLTNATSATLESVISTLSQELVASSSLSLTTTTLPTLVAAVRAIDSTPASATATVMATASMATLSYGDAKNWNRRTLTGSVAQNTVDSTGHTRYVDRRLSSNSGVLAVWGFGNEPANQTDLHWNGTAWVGCTLNMENPSTPRDAFGRSQYSYCDGLEQGVSILTAVDVSGRALKDVYSQVRSGGYDNLSISNADTVLGAALFPANSKLLFHVTTPLTRAPAYTANLRGDQRDTRADVASGNQTACNSITQATPMQNFTSLSTSLTGFVAARAGTPCVYGPGTAVVSTPTGTTTVSSGSRNEWWSQSTAHVGVIGSAPVGGQQTAYYTTNTVLAVAFGANQATNYYACQQRSTDGSMRNCLSIGSGTYTIATMGDAKVLSLENEPAQFSALNYRRIFVERGGKVHAGYISRLVVSNQARLNLVATNAVSAQLGMPAVDPETPQALTAASYQGDWVVNTMQPLDVFSGTTVRISANGASTQCFNNGNVPIALKACTVTLDPATGAITYSSTDGTASGTFNFNTGAASGTFTATGGAPAAFAGMRR